MKARIWRKRILIARNRRSTSGSLGAKLTGEDVSRYLNKNE